MYAEDHIVRYVCCKICGRTIDEIYEDSKWFVVTVVRNKPTIPFLYAGGVADGEIKRKGG
jgi:hypothetical protein